MGLLPMLQIKKRDKNTKQPFNKKINHQPTNHTLSSRSRQVKNSRFQNEVQRLSMRIYIPSLLSGGAA